MNKENLIECVSTEYSEATTKDGTVRYNQELYLWGTAPFPQKFHVSIDSPSDAFPIGFYKIPFLDFFEVQTNFGKINLSSPKYPDWKKLLVSIDPIKKEK